MGTSKAAVFVGQSKPLEIQEFPIPDLAPGSTLIRMEMAAICGTDAHALHHPATPTPLIFGHENIGTIAAARETAYKDSLGEPLKEGDRVIFRGAPCGLCRNCAMGDFCKNVRQPGFIPETDAPHLRGGFSQYVYLEPKPWLLKVPDDLSTERALLSVVGTHTLLNGYERIGGITLADTVVIQGSGPMGMGALLHAKLLGAGRVIVIGAPANRLALATKLGADQVVDIGTHSDPDARIQAIHDMTNGVGGDVVVECSGAIGATDEGLHMVRFGGKYLVVGPWTDYGPQSINPSLLTTKAVKASGVVASETRHMIRSMQALHTMIQVPAEEMITHQFPLENANEAFDVHERLEAMIAVIRPNGI